MNTGRTCGARAGLGLVDEALPAIVAALGHEASLVRLRALNALDRIGEPARGTLDAIRRATMPARDPAGERDHPADYVNRMVGYVPSRIDPEAAPRADGETRAGSS